MKNFFVSTLGFLLGLGIFLFPVVSVSFAADEVKGKPVDVDYRVTDRQANLGDWGDFSPVTSVGQLGEKILKFLLAILGTLALLGIIIGGLMMMFAGVDEGMLDRGKDILLFSIIGVAVALLAMGITTLVQTVFYSVDS